MSIASPRVLLATVACALASMAAPAGAADAPKKGNVLSLGQGKPSGKLLTRNELRACMAQEQRMKSLTEEAVALQKQLDADGAEIKRRDEELKQSVATLDRTNQEAINALKARAAENDEFVAAYNAKLPAFNEKANALQAERSAHAKDCADRPYSEIDYYAIKRGK